VKRAIILIIDSLGIGGAIDAEKFADQGANTLGHIAEYCYQNNALNDVPVALKIPLLQSLGLGEALHISCGSFPAGLQSSGQLIAAYGAAMEKSSGKDTTSGHWEMTGVPVLKDWGYFKDRENSFPASLINEFITDNKLPGILGNCHASGTEIIQQYGEEHRNTGKPIVYTSADSVMQIACHEESFGLDRLLDISKVARKLVDPYNIARIIARPFVGNSTTGFQRTHNRRDFSVPPLADTLFDKLLASGGFVTGIGKIPDIFCQQGISRSIKASTTDGLVDATIMALDNLTDRSIICTNFVDFDSSFGHRRDIVGYAKELEHFDRRLAEILAKLEPDDLLFISADHGCDPTWPGSDHTRENVPILVYGSKVKPANIGKRNSFSDIGQTIADYLNIPALDYGKSFLSEIIN